MKHSVSIILLTLCSFSARAQDGAGGSIAGFNEALCGFTPRLHFYREAGEVKQGLSVDLLSDQAQAKRPVAMRFFVNLKPGSAPLNNLQLEHEKLMHMIGVRDDLSGFFHIHPTKASPGEWEVNHTFSHGGRYKIWADVKWRGTSYSFGQQVINVSGDPGPSCSSVEAMECVTNSGYTVTLKHSNPLTTGRTNQLEFSVRDQAGNPVATENFLGVSMHLFTIKNDLSVYLHSYPENPLGSPAAIRFRQILRYRRHPGNSLPGDTVTRFRQIFPKPGTYKFFVQFRPKNTKLPADEAILAEFYANVLEEQ